MKKKMKKKRSATLNIIPNERVIKRIFLVRGKKVMFDSDLAEMYGVETRVLNQAVKRNKERFPEDFMFQLSLGEARLFVERLRSQLVILNNVGEESSLRSQIVTPSIDYAQSIRSQFVTASKRNIRYTPYVFTEQGVAMLSSVLKSKRAIQVNIHIMRVFTELREMLLTHKDLREKIEKMEQKYDKRFKAVFEAIRQLLKKEDEPAGKIGFREKQ